MAAKKNIETVCNFLKAANRPHCVSDIVQSLENVGKAVVIKSLDYLVEKGDVREKQYNKCKVYFYNQELISASQADADAVEGEIREVEDEIRALESEIGDIEREMQAYASGAAELTLEEATSQYEKVSRELKELNREMSELEETENKAAKSRVSADVLAEWKSRKEKYEKEWRKRKRIAMDMIEAVLENYPKTKKDLMEDIGVETDEMVGVSL